MRLVRFEPMTPLSLSRLSHRHIFGSNIVLPPKSEPPFVRKDRFTEITVHVPHTRVKGAPPSLTPTD